jgi:hypothetical protein
MRRIIWLPLLAACLIRAAGAQDRYKYFMELGEQGKRTGDGIVIGIVMMKDVDLTGESI